jgi:hypothetical protein
VGQWLRREPDRRPHVDKMVEGFSSIPQTRSLTQGEVLERYGQGFATALLPASAQARGGPVAWSAVGE